MLTALATTVPDSTLREQLSNLRSLHMLSILMMESRREEQILHLASTCVPAIASCHFRAITVDGRTLSEPARSGGATSADLEAEIATLDNPGGPVHLVGD
jgi:hypothetical protein